MALYDDPRFLAGYRELRRTGQGLNDDLEIPAMAALLPPMRRIPERAASGPTPVPTPAGPAGPVPIVAAPAAPVPIPAAPVPTPAVPAAPVSTPAGDALRVADLGCGEGDLAVRLASSGASVIAVDASASMLSQAMKHPRIRYLQADLAQLDLPDASLDLVVSSLALHYVEDFAALTTRVARWLVPGGQFLFSVEHPVITAPLEAADTVIDDYADEGRRQRNWFVDGVVKYHRTIGSTVEALLTAGFAIEALREPQPSLAQVEHKPHLAIHRRRPPLLLISARRAAQGVVDRS